MRATIYERLLCGVLATGFFCSFLLANEPKKYLLSGGMAGAGLALVLSIVARLVGRSG
jgi:hypothetical protein